MVFKRLKLNRYGVKQYKETKDIIVVSDCADECQILKFTYFPEENKEIREVFLSVYRKFKYRRCETIIIPEQAKEIIDYLNEVFEFVKKIDNSDTLEMQYLKKLEIHPENKMAIIEDYLDTIGCENLANKIKELEKA